MKVIAVVLNWRRADDTIACVNALQETAPEVDVIVVDNASEDGSVEKIRLAHPGLLVIENPENEGYAGGNNAGIKAALNERADAVFVLNNDAIVQPHCIERLANELSLSERHGIAAPLSLKADDPNTVDFFRATVDLKHMAVHAYGRDEPRTDLTTTDESDYATGSAMLIEASLLRQIGSFDERFFLVWEDVDLCLRARREGRKSVLIVPTAEVLHGRSVSFGGEGSPLYQYFFVRNSFLIVSKHVRWRAHHVRGLLERRYKGWLDQSEPQMRRAIEAGLADGLEGRFGPAPQSLVV